MVQALVAACVLVLAAGLLALVSSGRGIGWLRSRALPISWCGGSLVLVAAAFAARHPEPVPQRPDAPIEAPSPDYRASDACRACHPRQFDTWYGSYHRTMTQAASPEIALGSFDGAEHRFGASRYRLFQQGDALYGSFDGRRGGRAERIAPLVQTTGSHHVQIYWYPTGRDRMLAVYPLVYLVEAERWVPRSSAFVMPPGPEPASFGLWNNVCIECHTTDGRPGLLGGGTDSQVTEFGIACEACHGPGGPHLQANRSPLRRYQQHFADAGDDTIVNPERLSHVRSTQVCGQCHAVKTLHSTEEYADWMQHGSRFRPGDDLDETANIISNATLDRPSIQRLIEANPDFMRGSFWPDGIVRISGREYNGLLDTGCFLRGEMSCLSCHTLHQARDDTREPSAWHDDQLAPGMRGNAACTQCHAGFESPAEVAAHTHHPADSTGSECQNCHMPYTTYGLLKAIRSHRVDSPDLASEIAHGRPNACNLCHLDRDLEFTATALERWYGIEPPELPPDAARVAAGVRWVLEGDAGVRALAAWALAWPPAQQTAGTGWMAPYLLELLADPYDAVRLIATRSAATLPGFEDLALDPLGPRGLRRRELERLRARWQAAPGASQRSPETLFRPDGELRVAEFERLLERRDHTPLTLLE